jgi:hypothetical protein
MYKTILPLIVACTVLLLTSCKKQCVEGKQSFQAYGNFLPSKNVFLKGDTIVVNAWVPRCGNELYTNSLLCLDDNIEFETILGLTKLNLQLLRDSTRTGFLNANDDFTVMVTTGRYAGPIQNPVHSNRMAYYRTSKKGDKFQLTLHLICLETGVFRITLNRFYKPYERGQCGTLVAPMNLTFHSHNLTHLVPLPWPQHMNEYLTNGFSFRVD